MQLSGTFFLLAFGIIILGVLYFYKAGASWAKPALLLCSVLVLILAVVRVTTSKPKTVGEIMALHESFQAVCGEFLGDSLGERYPAARVTLLLPPKGGAFMRQAVLDRLQTSLEKNGHPVTVLTMDLPKMTAKIKASFALPDGPLMSPEEEARVYQAMMMESEWVNSVDLNQVLRDVKEQADVVICMFDHPLEVRDIGLLEKGRGPALIMFNVNKLDAPVLLETTVLDTVVLSRRNPDMWKPNATMPRKKQDAFDQRYQFMVAEK